MGCRNPKTKIPAENYETLGPKIQNSQKCNLKVAEGALKEAVHSYAIFSPNVSVESDETTKQERVVPFYGNLRRAVRFCRREDDLLEGLCNGFFKTYALIPC
jgi:hypothetical protein